MIECFHNSFAAALNLCMFENDSVAGVLVVLWEVSDKAIIE